MPWIWLDFQQLGLAELFRKSFTKMQHDITKENNTILLVTTSNY